MHFIHKELVSFGPGESYTVPILPIGIWGVNQHYNWKQICKVLAISCIAAVAIYTFTLFWVFNANIFNNETVPHLLKPLTFDFFADKISCIKHRLFLCSTEMMGIMALLYIRKDILDKQNIPYEVKVLLKYVYMSTMDEI